MAYKIGAYTLGCKVSQYETEAVLEEAERRGFTVCERDADAYIVNTCTVTAEGERKCRQLIRRIAKENPSAKILVCGCYSQVAPNELAKLECVDYISGTNSKLDIVKRAEALLCGKEVPRIEVSSLCGAEFEKMQIHRAPRTRAYVKIEDGCENRCAYCKIPEARGSVRSKSIADTVCEVTALAKSGVKEVVLTGIETASFGADSGEKLSDLLYEVEKIEGIERIRLGSLEPTLMKPQFTEKLAALKKLTPHFHLSMQSGCSRTLAAMKRKYNAETALSSIEAIRAAIDGVMLTTDFIVGFPGESDEDFNETLEFVKKARFLQTHVFKYSKRAGTAAAEMKNQISEEIKHARSRALIAACRDISNELLQNEILIRPIQKVLFEQRANGVWCGHTPSFIEVRVKCERDLHGRVADVKMISAENGWLTGEIV